MSKEEIGEVIGEEKSAAKASSPWGLFGAMVAKYGLPAIGCIWFSYVIQQKDQMIYQMSREVTTALVENNKARESEASAIRELADAVRRMQK